MKTASAKAKGRVTQKKVASKITEYLGLEEGDVVSRPMGSGGIDIMMSPKAKKRLPLSIECKHTKKHPSTKEMDQAERNRAECTKAAIAWQPHGSGQILITMDIDDFLIIWNERARTDV
jgi:hypothetical protein